VATWYQTYIRYERERERRERASTALSERSTQALYTHTLTQMAARNGWQSALLRYVNEPELCFLHDAKTVTVADAYPKATHHYLVIPREKLLRHEVLTREHIPLLRHMLMAGAEVIKRCTPTGDTDAHPLTRRFRCGFHVYPSMLQLHMHVISSDFVSPALKRKQHWYSWNDHAQLSSLSTHSITIATRVGMPTCTHKRVCTPVHTHTHRPSSMCAPLFAH
jgi:diadenosine tetraphosphate (Ap4A) HIT family hydrolase